MDVFTSRVNHENSDSSQIPPPPYTSVLYKLNESDQQGIFPPAYSDIDGQSITYVNNYPGPPLSDGHVRTSDEISIHYIQTRPSKNIRLYLIINGILTSLIGIAIVGIEIGILVTNSIIYFYYGFWGGGLVIIVGIGDILLGKKRQSNDYHKIFHSFFWQMILVAILLGAGITIIVTDRCNDSGTNNHGEPMACKQSHKVLDGCLLGLFAFTFLLSVINTVLFGFLKQ